MKQFFTLLLLSVIAVGLRAETSLTVKVTAPGELAAALGEDAKSIESLTVEGPVNATDFETMWRCSFEGKLTSLDLSKAEPVNNEIPDNAFWHEDKQGLFYDYYGHPMTRNPLPLRDLKLPAELTRIGDRAFMFTDVTSLNIPMSVRTYGIGTFLGCRLLNGPLPITESMESLPDSCFMYCGRLEITLPPTVRELGKATFQSSMITGDPFIIPEGIVEIPEGCFCNCGSVKNFQLPSTLKRIEGWAFHALVISPEEIDIPEGVEFIGESAFSGSGLKRIVIPASVKEIEINAFQESRMAKELVVSEGTQLTHIPMMMASASYDLEKVIIHDGVTSIGQQAFMWCGNLTDVRLPSTLKTLDYGVFQGCALRTVSFPAGMERIGQNCFDSGTLTSIYSDNPVPPYSFGAWRNVSPEIPVYIPKGSLEAYRENIGWRYFSNFIETEGTPSGLDDIDLGTESVKVRAESGAMMIETDVTTDYSVYQSDGRLVKYGRVSAPGLSLDLPSGLYVVKAGSTVSKIVL